MSISSKQIAKQLGLSQAAVSLALNNKPGVSQKTRDLVLNYAEKNGYNLDKHRSSSERYHILFIIYQEYSVALNYQYISGEMLDGITEICQSKHCTLSTIKINNSENAVEKCIAELNLTSVDGLLILGTSITAEVAKKFTATRIPTVILDCPLDSIDCCRVCINNFQGGYIATNYLINKRESQPGYLASNIRLENFNERKQGFIRALNDNGLSYSNSIVHALSPSIDGAFSDFIEILERKEPLADCYFADNDLIAAGVIKALSSKGYHLPEDLGIVGFDNIDIAQVLQPSLSSVSFSRKYLGQVAINQLLSKIQNKNQPNVKIQIDTRLVKRLSI